MKLFSVILLLSGTAQPPSWTRKGSNLPKENENIFLFIYYKELKPWILHPLTKVCNDILGGGRAPETWQEAFITLIPKEDSDPLQVKNYRPISLLNVDYKIFAQVLARRLKVALNDIIYKDQTGFLPGRHMSDNVRNIIDIIEMLDARKDYKALLIFIDAEKAFDNISWNFMKCNLDRMKLGKGFMNGLNAIYSKQKAKLIINN